MRPMTCLAISYPKACSKEPASQAYLSSSTGIAADDRQDLAGDVACAARRGHENKGGCDLFRLRRALHRGRAPELRNLLGLLVCWVKRRPYGARSNCIHANAALDEVRRKRAREGVNAAFGGRVIEKLLVAFNSGDGACHYDRAAGLHMGHRRLRHMEIAVQVRFHGAVEMFFGQVLKLRHMLLKGGIVDQDVELTELLDGLLHGRLAESKIRHVSSHGHA